MNISTYIQDNSFPNTAGFDIKDVSWLTLSPDGTELYLLQRGLPCVSVWDLNGNHLRDWDTNELACPHSLKFQVIQGGGYRIWITDMASPSMTGDLCGHCIKQFDTSGNYLGSIGVCGENSEGTGVNPVQFDKVTDVSFDSGGYMWVTDGDLNGLNNRVLQINPLTQEVVQEWSAPNNLPGSGPKEFHLPHSIDVDDLNRVWVADALNNRVQIIGTDGTFLQELKCFGSDGVYGVRVRRDPSTGLMQLYVTTSPTNNPTGGVVKIFPVAQHGIPVPDNCFAEYEWSIHLQQGTSTGMLHMIDATSNGQQLFIATLGGDLRPQKWIKVYEPDEDSPA
ncbi:MAG: hypothetical protein JJ975_00625 [Bacteroidia bacterium]|nr:hypothetical protein [Bacteroidia bacterium]